MSIEVISMVELVEGVELPKNIEVDFVVITYGTFDLDDEKAHYFSTYKEAMNFYKEVYKKVPTEFEIIIETFYDNDSEIETIEIASNYKVVETKEWRYSNGNRS